MIDDIELLPFLIPSRPEHATIDIRTYRMCTILALSKTTFEPNTYLTSCHMGTKLAFPQLQLAIHDHLRYFLVSNSLSEYHTPFSNRNYIGLYHTQVEHN